MKFKASITVDLPMGDVEEMVALIFHAALENEKELIYLRHEEPMGWECAIDQMTYSYKSLTIPGHKILLSDKAIDDYDLSVVIKTWIVRCEHSVGMFFEEALFKQVIDCAYKISDYIQRAMPTPPNKFTQDEGWETATVTIPDRDRAEKSEAVLLPLLKKIIDMCMERYANNDEKARKKLAEKDYNDLVIRWSKRQVEDEL